MSAKFKDKVNLSMESREHHPENVACRPANPDDAEPLVRYFQQLSNETRQYFAPHPFDPETVSSICAGNYGDFTAFICLKGEIIAAYAVVKKGYSEGELYRFPNYAILMNPEKDYLLAPSVADSFQSQGIGTMLLAYLETELKKTGAEKIILWGGVQLMNQRAVRYYLSNGFRTLGEFHYNGLDNLDMVKHLND